MAHSLIALWMALILIAAKPAAAEAPRVVATIKPVHSLVAAVMRGIGEPELLLAADASPHLASLRPSQARMLHEADLFVWVGDGLETFLAKPIATIAAEDRVLTLVETDGLSLLRTREGGIWRTSEHAETHANWGAIGVDMHLWLSPKNAMVILDALAARLARIDPAHAELYRTNARDAKTRVAALQRRLQERLGNVRDRPYLVSHDAFAYFDRAFGLRPVGAIAIDPERQAGAAHIGALRRMLSDGEVACVFAEPQIEPRLVARLLEGTGARTGTLDPLGIDIAPGPQAWEQLMTRLADDLLACLEPKP